MTAYAGDALSHDYFSWPQKQFFTADFQIDFQADFQAPIRDGSAARFSRPRPCPGGCVSCKLIGSTRICMGAMNLRHRPIPVPRGLLGATA